MGEQRLEGALEGLFTPILILTRQGSIRFMNGAARRLLAEGIDQRLVSYICKNPDREPITQVHFKLQNGHDLVLKVRLGEVEWGGEKVMQASLWNVTPYLAMIQELQKTLGTQKQALEELAARRPGLEQQPAAHSETLARVQAELEAQSADRAKAQEDASGLRENLDLVTQENSRLRGFVSRAAALAASLEEARQQTEAQALQRAQAQADLEKARAVAAASEEIQSKLRQESEALARDLAAARQETERAVSEAHACEAEFGRVNEKLAAQVKTLQSGLTAATAEREELRRKIADRLAGESSVRAEMEAELAKRQSLEKEIAALRQDLAVAEQAQPEWAETFEKLKGEARGHADALARAREEAAEAARFAKAQQTKAAEAEKQAASTAWELKLEARKSAEASQTWETERAEFVSRAAALAASLEQARQQTEAEALHRKQAQADLEKARAAASASEQVHSKFRQESEALARDLAAARQETERAVSEAHARESESGRVSEKLAAQVKTLQSGLTAATAEREELRRKIADRLAGESSVRAEMEAELAKRQSLEKEIAALRKGLAVAEQARSEWAETFEKLKGEARGHADALARAREEAANRLVVSATVDTLTRAREEAAEAARLAQAQQTKAAEAEKQAALTARELKLEARKSAEASRTWETERAGFVSRATALAASLELARQQTSAVALQRGQAQADLEKARAAASASEQIPFQAAPGIGGAPAQAGAVQRRRRREILGGRETSQGE